MLCNCVLPKYSEQSLEKQVKNIMDYCTFDNMRDVENRHKYKVSECVEVVYIKLEGSINTCYA